MITVFYHPDSYNPDNGPIPSGALILLGYASNDTLLTCSNANSGFTSNYYINDSNFLDATILATNSTLSSFAIAGYYSDGFSWRYWSGSVFNLNGLCAFSP